MNNSSGTFFIRLGDDEDVIECDLPINSFTELVKLAYTEYNLHPATHRLTKVRKLPNILVRNDKDVARLKNGDTIQIRIETAK